MKIEQLLVQHFYNAKQVTLQGIGTFKLSPDLVMPLDSEKELVLPNDAISFEYNPKATEDGALINYIVQQTRKIKPLASADLESYLMLASQFLNIGKPFKIEGIGMLEKNQLGEYQFLQGHLFNTKTEQAETQLKEKTGEDISFSNEAKPSGNGKKILLALVLVAVLGAIGMGAWYLFNNKKADEPIAVKIPEPQKPVIPVTADTSKPDTSNIILQKPDSIVLKPKVDSGGYTFKVVIKNYPSLLPAQKSFNRLTSYGHKLLLYTPDSVTFKVAMPFTRPLSDTTYAKDSVRKVLFGGNPYIELQ